MTGALLASSPAHAAMRMLQSTSLNQCDGSTASGFSATLFNVVFTPDNGTLSYNINAISSISQKVVAQLNIIAYGLVAFNKTIDPCDEAGFSTLCPLNPGSIPINSNSQLPPSASSQIPGLAYTVRLYYNLEYFVLHSKVPWRTTPPRCVVRRVQTAY